MTKFTIGTSDEDDENDEDTSRDLEKLFCPLTDSNGAPYDMADKDLQYQGSGEQLSASSCRRVQSEIMASVSRIKCSILGRKGGLLHNYSLLETSSALGQQSSGGSLSVPHISVETSTPIMVTPPTPTHGHQGSKTRGGSKSQPGSIRRSKSPAGLTNSITVSLPSPAGHRKPSSANHEGGSKGTKSGTGNNHKKWDKYSKVRKATKTNNHSNDKGEPDKPPAPRSRIGSSASASSLKLFDSGSETPPLRHIKTKRPSKKKKMATTGTSGIQASSTAKNSQSMSKLKDKS